MRTYFPERKKVGEFVLPVKNGRLYCQVFEQWEDIELSTTAHCGDKGSIEIEKTVGISLRDVQTLSGSLEASIGIEAIAQFKSKVEEIIQQEVSWSESKTFKKKIEFTSPECGAGTRIVYQLVREYDLTFYPKPTFWNPKPICWERRFREKTNSHDILRYEVKFDESCGCASPETTPHDGLVNVVTGNVSMRVPFSRNPDGLEINLEGVPLKIPQVTLEDFSVQLPTKILPEIMIFLGDIKDDSVEASFSEYRQTPMNNIAILNAFNPIATFNANIITEEGIKRIQLNHLKGLE